MAGDVELGGDATPAEDPVRRLVRQVETRWTRMADTPGDSALSWRRLRQAVGILGTVLPLLLWTTVLVVEGRVSPADSISDYYFTPARDVFVGVVVTVGVFLLFYRPFRLDSWLTSAAGVLAVVVALVPAGGDVRVVHLVAAALLFLVLAMISLTLFTRRAGPGSPTPTKIRQNVVHRVAGWSILALLVLAAVAGLTGILDWWPDYLFWLEAAMLVAFGLSWFVKGRASHV